jgi:hypothetical protein
MMAQFQDLEHELHLDGFSDGFSGGEPKLLEVTYLQGYAQGSRAKINALLSQINLFTTDRARYEQIYSLEQEF